jgi:hypothetical protein
MKGVGLDMYEDENNEDNKFEIVQGNSKDLNFSEVKDNLTIEEHQNNVKKNGEVIVPEEQDTNANNN